MKFHKLKEHQKSSGGGNSLYLRVDDGAKIVIVPRGEIFGFRVKWDNEGKATEIPESNPENFNRFKTNVAVNEGGKYVVKIWEFGIKLYRDLHTIAESVGIAIEDKKEKEKIIERTKLELSRAGAKKDTEWGLRAVGLVDSITLNKLESVKLNILGSTVKEDMSHITGQFNTNIPPADIPYFGDDPGVTEEDLPF